MSYFLSLPVAAQEAFLASVLDDPTGRMAEARKRVDIETGDFSHLITDIVSKRYTDPEIKKEICAYATNPVYNPMKLIVDLSSVAYKSPPIRAIEAADEIQKKFSDLLSEGKIGRKAASWLRWVLINNVVIVVPRIATVYGKQKLIWDMRTPDKCQVITHPEDYESVAVLGYHHGEDIVEVTDDMATMYFRRTKGSKSTSDKWQLENSIEHATGVFPGSVFRVDEPLCDFWSSTRGCDFIHATVESNFIATVMNYIRKSQNRKYMHVAATDIDKALAQGQLLHAERPLEANAAPGEFDFVIQDGVTKVEDFLAHIQSIINVVSKAHGIPEYLIDNVGTEPAIMSQVEAQEALDIKRKHQTEYLRSAEHELLYKTALIAKKFGHPLSIDPEIIASTLNITWGPPSFVDDPLRKLDLQKKKIELGIGYSQVDVVLEDDPSLTEDEALAKIKKKIEERKIVADYHAATNMPADATLKTLAQVNGSMGGQASVTSRGEQEDDVTDDAEDSAEGVTQ